MLLTDYFRSERDLTWDFAKQCGVNHGVIRLPETADFDICDFSHWKDVYQRFTNFGITPVIIEPMPNELHDHIKVGDEKRDECIEKAIKMFPIMDKLDIRCICFNWMAHVGWLRTKNDVYERGGARVTGFDINDFVPVEAKITKDKLWDNYEYFIKAVIPFAEKYGIKLALHPDDPPRDLGAVERIMTSADNIEHAINEIVKSDKLGITMCQATYHIMGEKLSEVIQRFKDKIMFIHFRNTRGSIDSYTETFHDNGEIDMAKVMKIYKECGIDVPIRVDHVPTLIGEDEEVAGYSALGRLYAIGYLKGILDATNDIKEANKMIAIKNEIKKQQNNFWNNCLFHPTDAVEDAWGKRILDRMAEDKAIQTIRIYTMFEDIVLMDENGNLTYDFRVNDLRLDYLVEKGYDVLLAYGMMPECIAVNKNANTSMSKNKTRYKGKLINTSIPTDYKIWEEICYEYTKHIVDRYGIDVVSKWHVQCFNEADHQSFFLSYIPIEDLDTRLREYCNLYTAFANGILRVSDQIKIGGPALATHIEFLEGFLCYVNENDIRLDFISVHNYADMKSDMLKKGEKFSVSKWMDKQQNYMDVITKCGFADTEIIVDEWGMAAEGFFNIEECPAFIARENEVYSSYYVKLIYKILEKGWNISKLLICLSGQHEMVTDFSGFRNFFTLNFFAKPIYNAYVLGAKLHENFLDVRTDNENIFVLPTKNDNDEYAVLLTYSSEYFEEDLPEIKEEITFDADLTGKKATIYCIDKDTTNPYRLYQKKGITKLSDADIKELREEGNLKPISKYTISDKIEVKLTANSVYLIMID